MARREEYEVGLVATDQAASVVGDLADKIDQLPDGEVTLTADDEASATVEEVDQAVDDLDGKTAEATISAEDKAKDEIDEVMTRLRDLEDEEVVAVLSAKAAKLESEIKRANELLAGVDGERAEAIIDAKDLATARLNEVRGKIDEVRLRNVQLDNELKTVDDQSKSVGANFAGNLVQELPGISGAFGPLTMALGQFAEYATEGNINFKNFLKTIGPIAVAAGGFFAVRNVIRFINEDTREAEALQKRFREALEETGDLAEAVRRVVADEGGIFTPDDDSFADAMIEGIFGIEDAAKDLVPVLNAAGTSLDEWTAGITGGADERRHLVQEWEEARDQGRITQEQLESLQTALYGQQAAAEEAAGAQAELNEFMQPTAESLDALLQGLLNAEDPTRRMADEWRILGKDLRDGQIDFDDTSGAVQRLADALGIEPEEVIQIALDEERQAAEDAAKATQTHIDALNEQAEALAESADALLEQADAYRVNADAVIKVDEAEERAREALDKYNAAVEESGEESSQAADAAEDLRDAAIRLADAKVEAAQASAQMRGATLSATEAIDIENASLASQAQALQGPARQAILDHIQRINGIPDDVMTQINAAIEAGDIPAAQLLIASVSGRRQLTVDAELNQGKARQLEQDVAYLTRQRTIDTVVRAIAAGGKKRATGDPYTSEGWYRAGEQGEEDIYLPAGSRIMNAAETAAADRARGGTVHHHYHNTVNMPAGSDPTATMTAIRRYEQQQAAI